MLYPILGIGRESGDAALLLHALTPAEQALFLAMDSACVQLPEDSELEAFHHRVAQIGAMHGLGFAASVALSVAVRGTVPALTTISIAERTGMMAELGAWVLDRSCRDHAAWCAEHPSRRLSLSVNVSVRQLAQPHYVDAVAATVADTGMDPTLLILDEPTRGIDVGAKAEIQKLVYSLAENGMSVLFISAELEEVLRLSNRIVVLRDRQKVADLRNDGLDVDDLLALIAEGATEPEPVTGAAS